MSFGALAPLQLFAHDTKQGLESTVLLLDPFGPGAWGETSIPESRVSQLCARLLLAFRSVAWRGCVCWVSLGAVLRSTLQVVALQVVALLGCGSAALCVLRTLVRSEHMVLLRSLSSAPPTFLASYRYRASSMCFVQLTSLLVHLSSLRSSCTTLAFRL